MPPTNGEKTTVITAIPVGFQAALCLASFSSFFMAFTSRVPT